MIKATIATRFPGFRARLVLGMALWIAASGGQALAADSMKATADRIHAMDKPERPDAVCEILQVDFVAQTLGIYPATLTYRAGSHRIPHPLCHASWGAHQIADVDEACRTEMADYTEQWRAARQASTDFDVALPACIQSGTEATASLTLFLPTFPSDAEAVAHLEGTVAMLEEGITITVGGKERTRTVDYDDFLDGVGDQAAWAPKLQELSVAAGGVRFAVSVDGTGSTDRNKALAIQLAKRMVEAF